MIFPFKATPTYPGLLPASVFPGKKLRNAFQLSAPGPADYLGNDRHLAGKRNFPRAVIPSQRTGGACWWKSVGKWWKERAKWKKGIKGVIYQDISGYSNIGEWFIIENKP